MLFIVVGCAPPGAGEEASDSLLPLSPRAGGQTGSLGPDTIEEFELEPTQATPLGFSAEQAQAALGGTHTVRLRYADDRPETRLQIEVSLKMSPPPLYEDWTQNDENDALVLPADVHVYSDDGAFDERHPLRALFVREGLVARIQMVLEVGALGGTYRYPVPGGGEGRLGSMIWDFELDAQGRSAGTVELQSAEPHYEGARLVAEWDDGPAPEARYERTLEDVRACDVDIQWGPRDTEMHRCHSLEAGDDARFTCECAGTPVSMRANDCDMALEQACEVDGDTPNECSDASGRCFPQRDGEGFACTCADGEDGSVGIDSCEGALFQVCARPCSDPDATCVPADGEHGYDCQCADGSSPAWRGPWSCAALLTACQPRCMATQGSCDLRPDGYACRCADGSEAAIAFDASSGVCLRAVEIACGPVPAGEMCEEVEDWGRTYRCAADGEGGWDCECPPDLEPSDGGGPGNTVPGAVISTAPGPDNADAKVFEGRALSCRYALGRDC